MLDLHPNIGLEKGARFARTSRSRIVQKGQINAEKVAIFEGKGGKKKMRRLFLIVLLLFGLFIFSSSPSFADDLYFQKRHTHSRCDNYKK